MKTDLENHNVPLWYTFLIFVYLAFIDTALLIQPQMRHSNPEREAIGCQTCMCLTSSSLICNKEKKRRNQRITEIGK